MKLHWKILISLILSFTIGLWANLSIDNQSTSPAWFNGLKETCLRWQIVSKRSQDGGNSLGGNLHYLRSFQNRF